MINSLPGVVGQGLIWGLMAMGVYITFRILDVADLTVDGTLGFGGAVCVLLTLNGVNVWLATLFAMLAGMLAGLVTGLFHTKCGIPAILAGILTQLALYSINLRVMGWGTTAGTQATLAISVDKYDLILSSRYVRDLGENIWQNPIIIMIPVTIAVVAVLWWYFKTEHGSALRATGANIQMARGMGILRTALWVVGLLTLLSGVVGVSNIMLITVRERTREFGIRKAIGARPWSILRLIIIESVVMTTLFGYVGMLCGIAANEYMNATIGRTEVDTGLFKATMFANPTVGVDVCIEATLVMVLAGTLAGLVPARRAARVRPIEALKEN